MYDAIIIGSGMSGLYAAYKIKRMSPTTTFLILEKNKKSGLGGRAGNVFFCGAQVATGEVATGAGIGRRKKDKLLYRLLEELSIEPEEITSRPRYSALLTHRVGDIPEIMDHLRGIITKSGNNKRETSKSSQSASS